MIPLAEQPRVAKVLNRKAQPASEKPIPNRMKLATLLPIIAAAALATPFSALAKDKHDGGKHHGGGGSHHGSYHGNHYSYRSYPSYRYGGFGYGGFGYYSSFPSYYRPSLRLSYSSYSRPVSVYRGVQVGRSYSDSLAIDVQRELRRRGYYRGSIDGDIGPGSRAAIRAYQRERGLSATGRIDTSLLRSLGIG